MHLTAEEQSMLAGEEGPAVRRAMEIIVALGKIYGAQELVPVSSVQVAGVSYKNLGQAGLEFLREWAGQGARVRVPTMLNPAGMDLKRWPELGIPEDFARQQLEIVKTFEAMGVTSTLTCTPYLVGSLPKLGEHIAWSESSAVSFANSVLGARSNREGGPSALAAAITGRTANYGLHLDENRRANYIIDVRCPLKTMADWGALGYMVGQRVKDGVPYFKGLGFEGRAGAVLEFNSRAATELRALGAAMAASGAVALYHVEGVTPEARTGRVMADDVERLRPEACPERSRRAQPEGLVVDSLREGYEALNSAVEEIDLVWIGCPHASRQEIQEVADLLTGKRVKAKLWVTTARQTAELARQDSLVERIEAAGGRVISDTCLVVAPVEALGIGSVATNSGKGAFYLPGHCGVKVRFGSLERCVEAAVTGRWLG